MRPGLPALLTAAQQFLNLRTSPVCAGAGVLRPGGLTWTFNLRPTVLSRVYRLRIEYRQGGVPQVFVEDPDLVELANGRLLPHVYEQKPTRLCLYQPARSEWHSGLLISQTIIQWAALWLFYFEEWLTSDEWAGGGEHPPIRSPHRREPGRQRGAKSGLVSRNNIQGTRA